MSDNESQSQAPRRIAAKPSRHPTSSSMGSNSEDNETQFAEDHEVSFADPPGMADTNVDKYVELARRIPQDGFTSLIEAGLQDELASGSPIGKRKDSAELKPVWTHVCTMFFGQMHQEALIECISGNIDLAYRHSNMAGSDLAPYLDKLKERSKEHPSCYVRPLTDKDGKAPDVDDMQKLTTTIWAYVTFDGRQDATCSRIDMIVDPNWTSADSLQGKRFALAASAKEVSAARTNVAMAWVSAVDERLRYCRENDVALAPPLQYIGYAMNAHKRETQHDGSSSWFTELIKAACEHLFGDKYSFKFYVICLIPDESLGPWLEAVLSRFMRAYAHDGGFRIAWGGVSTESLCLPDLGSTERDGYWAEKQDWIKAHTPFEDNLKIELARGNAFRQRRRAELRASYTAQIDKKLGGAKIFVKEAYAAHALVEKRRAVLEQSHPALVARVDASYAEALEIERLQKPRDELD